MVVGTRATVTHDRYLHDKMAKAMRRLGFKVRGWAPEPRPLDVADTMEGPYRAMCWLPALNAWYYTRYQPSRAPGFLAARARKFFGYPLHISHQQEFVSK